jgi:hypothetical protein
MYCGFTMDRWNDHVRGHIAGGVSLALFSTRIIPMRIKPDPSSQKHLFDVENWLIWNGGKTSPLSALEILEGFQALHIQRLAQSQNPPRGP